MKIVKIAALAALTAGMAACGQKDGATAENAQQQSENTPVVDYEEVTITEELDNAADNAAAAGQDVKDAAEKAAQKVKDAAAQKADDVKDAAAKAAQDAKDAAAKAAQDAKDAAAKAAQDAKDAAKNELQKHGL